MVSEPSVLGIEAMHDMYPRFDGMTSFVPSKQQAQALLLKRELELKRAEEDKRRFAAFPDDFMNYLREYSSPLLNELQESCVSSPIIPATPQISSIQPRPLDPPYFNPSEPRCYISMTDTQRQVTIEMNKQLEEIRLILSKQNQEQIQAYDAVRFSNPEATNSETISRTPSSKLSNTLNRWSKVMSFQQEEKKQVYDGPRYSNPEGIMISPDPPDPPDYNHLMRIKEAKAPRLQNQKISLKYSCEEIYQRMEMGLCIFCDEQDTPNHQLKHNESRICMIEDDDDHNLAEPDVDVERIVDVEETKEQKAHFSKVPNVQKHFDYDLLVNNVETLGLEDLVLLTVSDEVDVETLIRNKDEQLLEATRHVNFSEAMTVSTRLFFSDVLFHINAAERAIGEEISLMEEPTKSNVAFESCESEKWQGAEAVFSMSEQYLVKVSFKDGRVNTKLKSLVCLSDALRLLVDKDIYNRSLRPGIESPATQSQDANAAQQNVLIQSREEILKRMEVTLSYCSMLIELIAAHMPEKVLNGSKFVLLEPFQSGIWSLVYNRMPQNVSAIRKLDCRDLVFNSMFGREELLRTRRNQKLLKSWLFKFKFKSHTLTSKGNITLLRKQGVLNLSDVMFVSLNRDSQTLLDGTAEQCEVLFEKFSSIDSSYKACLLLELIYLEFIGSKTHGKKLLVAGLTKGVELGAVSERAVLFKTLLEDFYRKSEHDHMLLAHVRNRVAHILDHTLFNDTCRIRKTSFCFTYETDQNASSVWHRWKNKEKMMQAETFCFVVKIIHVMVLSQWKSFVKMFILTVCRLVLGVSLTQKSRVCGFFGFLTQWRWYPPDQFYKALSGRFVILWLAFTETPSFHELRAVKIFIFGDKDDVKEGVLIQDKSISLIIWFNWSGSNLIISIYVNRLVGLSVY